MGGSANRRTRVRTATEPASRIRICERMSPAIGPHHVRGPMLAFTAVTFSAHFDPATARLALAGDCRMTDAQLLEQELAAVRAAAPRNLHVDVGGRLDIGPS